MKYFILAFMLAGPAAAGTCPASPDHSDQINRLIMDVKDAPDADSAHLIANDLWSYWADAPDAEAQALLDEGMSRREAFDYEGAMVALNALVEYCPDYAEGYNQRAFVNFLRRDFAAALPDLEHTVVLSPQHIGAMTGQALTLAALERNGEAALILRAALKLNPWLSERRLLPVLEATEDAL